MSATKISPISTPDTTAREICTCNECKVMVHVGERITKVSTLGSAQIAVNGKLPEVMEELIAAIQENQVKIYHSECAKINESKTKSGRKVRAPVRLSNEKFVSGSGFAGCDHYDFSFDGNLPTYEDRQTYSKNGQNLGGFVVTDDEPIEQLEILESEEDEWDSSEDTEEDEEEFYDDEDD
jgi:hypothetical protein